MIRARVNAFGTTSVAPRRLALLCLTFLGLWALCLLPMLLEGTLPGPASGDTNRQFVPYRDYMLRCTAQGRLPEFALGMYAGHPMMSLGQTALLYPVNLTGILLRLPHHLYFWLDMWLHLAGASVAMALLLLGRGNGLLGAVALGWAYANSSAVLFRATGHWTLLHQTPWLPLVLHFWLRLGDAARTGRLRDYAGIGIALSVMALAQNPHWVYVVVIILLPLEIGRWARLRGTGLLGKHLYRLSCWAVTAVGLSAIIVVPMLAWVNESFRAELRGQSLARVFPLSISNLKSLAFPTLLFGDNLSRFYGQWYPVESVVVIGRGVLLLALIGLIVQIKLLGMWTARLALPFMLVAGGLFLGTAPQMPWFAWLADFLPGYSSLRAWGRASIFVVLGLLCFAGDGIDALWRAVRGYWAVFALLAIGGLGFAVQLMFWFSNAPAEAAAFVVHSDVWSLQRGNRSLMVDLLRSVQIEQWWYLAWSIVAVSGFVFPSRWPGVLSALIFCGVALESFHTQRMVFRQRSRIVTPRDYPGLQQTVQELVQRQAPAPATLTFEGPDHSNWGLYFSGVRSLSGFDPNARRDYLVYLNRLLGQPDAHYQLETQLSALPDNALRRDWDLSARIFDGKSMQMAQPFVISEFEQVRPYVSVALGEGNANVTDWSDGRVELTTSMERAGQLLVQEFFDRRWRILVNGASTRPSPLESELNVQSDSARSIAPAMIIPVGVGESRIEMRYVDMPARVGLAISVMSWLSLCLFALWRYRGLFRRPRRPV